MTVSHLLIIFRSWPFATDADGTCQTLYEITFRDIQVTKMAAIG